MDCSQLWDRFPLFCKSTEQKQFEAGCHLLNKNIEHVTASHPYAHPYAPSPLLYLIRNRYDDG
jgi:hypothetical protein